MQSKPTLRDYQIVDLAFLMAEPRAGILHDPGGGKTPPVCVYLYYKWTELQQRSIWVMPKQLLKKNLDELLRFTHFTAEDVAIVDNPKDYHKAAKAKVFLMGPRRFTLIGQPLLDAFPDIRNVVGDETHMYWANHKSQDTQALYAVMDRLGSEAGFVPMTGSLIKGKLSSAYPVIKVFNPLYYSSYESFEYQHAIKDDFGNVQAWVRPERIGEIISKHCIRRSFESIYGKESKVIVTELCQMSTEQRDAYDEFEARAIIELENEFLEGATGGVFALRCRQIMAHPELYKLGASGKDAQLDIHISNHAASGEPCAVFAAFVPEQERIARRIQDAGMTVGLLNGNTSPKKRHEIDEDFKAGKLQWIVGSPQVATVGYNWEHCGHCIFTTLDYADDAFYQAYRRFIRGIRSSPLLITILEYENSLDQRVMAIIKRKSKLASSIDGREVFDLSVS